MKNKIKIAFFISNLGQGGAENQFVQLIKGLDKNIFDVHVYLYAYQKKAFFDEVFLYENITVTSHKLKKKIPLFKIIEALSYIRKRLFLQKFDVVYTTLFMNGFFVRLASPRSYKNKIVASVRSSIRYYHYYYKSFLLAEKCLIKNSFLVFNSKNSLSEFKPIFRKKHHNRLKMIYNGFMFPTIHEKNNEKNNKIHIGGIGRQSKQKNFLQIVRVFNELNSNLDEEKKINLILQGNEGDQTQEIRQQVMEGNSDIELRKPNPKIESFFSDIEIMILPSSFEGCPNVLFESMAYKRICIISEGANSDDFVINGVNGFVYDGTDAGLLKSLKNALSIIGTKSQKKIVDSAYSYATQNFNMEIMVNNYEELFKGIYEKNKSSN